MKKRHFVLGALILATTAILGAYGTYLKINVLKPLDLYQDQSIFSLPFLMYSDDYLRFMVENAEEIKQMQQQATAPSTTPTKPTFPTPGTINPGNTSSSTPGTTDSTSSDTIGTTESTSSSTQTDSTTQTQPGSTSDTTNSTSSNTTNTTTSTTAPTTNTTTDPTTTPPTDSGTAPIVGPDFNFPEGVGDDWFDNTLFIGDSRVVGLREYARSGNADYFCDVGLTIFACEKSRLSDKTFSNCTLGELLAQRKYDKIIVNFGLNECGYPDSSFRLKYRNLVDMLKETQPDAIIILQGIMSVSKSKADTAEYLQPSFIAQRSAYIASLCDGERVFYVDCNEYFTDENGYLLSSITNDGYHPTVAGYRHWRNWLSFILEQIGL